MGSVRRSYDNAMAETVIGLLKTEVIRHRGKWQNLKSLEYPTLGWVDRLRNISLPKPIGSIPPVQLERAYYTQEETPDMAAGRT